MRRVRIPTELPFLHTTVGGWVRGRKRDNQNLSYPQNFDHSNCCRKSETCARVSKLQFLLFFGGGGRLLFLLLLQKSQHFFFWILASGAAFEQCSFPPPPPHFQEEVEKGFTAAASTTVNYPERLPLPLPQPQPPLKETLISISTAGGGGEGGRGIFWRKTAAATLGVSQNFDTRIFQFQIGVKTWGYFRIFELNWCFLLLLLLFSEKKTREAKKIPSCSVIASVERRKLPLFFLILFLFLPLPCFFLRQTLSAIFFGGENKGDSIHGK